MRDKNRLGRYLIGVLVFLCCTTTVAHAQPNENTVLNATVFIDTDVSNGSGFYVGPNIIATSFNLISGAKWIDAYAGDSNINVESVLAYNAKRNLAILRVTKAGNPLPLSESNSLQPDETIYIAGHSSRTSKRLETRQTSSHQSRDFCQAGVKFPITIDSDGGPVLGISGKVKGIFFIGMLEFDPGLPELNYSFVVPVKFLRDLINGPWSMELPPITLELDYCTLISRANARIRKASRSGSIDARKLRSDAKLDFKKAAKQLAKVRKIPWRKILKILSKL